MYSYGKQVIEEDDIQAVINILKSDWLTQGPSIEKFEKALCARFGCEYAVAVTNGTAALHLAALALGWGKNEIVLTSPLTFLASANCVLYAGATPDFVDIDPKTYTIDPSRLEDKIKLYRGKNKNIKAIVAVDFAGHPCDWQALGVLAKKYEFQLVDDACHALGAKFKNREICSAHYADLVVCSFHPVKHITTGEGGAILTNQAELAEKLRRLRSHGVTKDEKLLEQNHGPWYYEMVDLGFNYRITDMQCALGVSQLGKLDTFIEKRQQIASFYDEAFGRYECLTIPQRPNEGTHVYHLYPLQIDFENLGLSRIEFFHKLRQKNIIAQVHYIPVHLQPYYGKKFGFKPGDFPIAEQFYRNEISLPIYPSLHGEDLQSISSSILASLRNSNKITYPL